MVKRRTEKRKRSQPLQRCVAFPPRRVGALSASSLSLLHLPPPPSSILLHNQTKHPSSHPSIPPWWPIPYRTRSLSRRPARCSLPALFFPDWAIAATVPCSPSLLSLAAECPIRQSHPAPSHAQRPPGHLLHLAPGCLRSNIPHNNSFLLPDSILPSPPQSLLLYTTLLSLHLSPHPPTHPPTPPSPVIT